MDGAAVAEDELNVAEIANENEAHLLRFCFDLCRDWQSGGATRYAGASG